MIKTRLLLVVIACCLTVFPVRRVQACTCLACDCFTLIALNVATGSNIVQYVEGALRDLINDYIQVTLVEDWWWPALRAFTEQITLNTEKTGGEIMASASTAGKHYDKQVRIQEKKSKAIVETLPNEGTCTVISAGIGVIASDAKSKAARAVLTRQGIGRSIGIVGDIASRGPGFDFLDRFQGASSRYLTQEEMNGALVNYSTGTNDKRYNADISPSTLFKPTLNVDFSTGMTPDREDLTALKANLYNDTILTRLTQTEIAQYGGTDEFSAMQGLTALQATAEWPFDAIAALKVEGDPLSGASMRNILTELGYTPVGIDHLIGANDKPSYLQQLEILSKTMQNSPSARVKEVVTPVEAMRKLAIKEGLALVIKFEIYNSLKRSTIQATILHELKRRELQEEWEAQPIFTGGPE